MAVQLRRNTQRRLRCAHIGRFKPLADFDWAWPEQCDQRAISELMTLDFLDSATNAILIGSSGLGKTMIAQNIAHQAVLQGHTVLFATAGQLLGELASLDSDSALRFGRTMEARSSTNAVTNASRVTTDRGLLRLSEGFSLGIKDKGSAGPLARQPVDTKFLRCLDTGNKRSQFSFHE